MYITSRDTRDLIQSFKTNNLTLHDLKSILYIYISITDESNNKISRALDYVRCEITQEMYDSLNKNYLKLQKENRKLAAQNSMLIRRLCSEVNVNDISLENAMKSNYSKIDLI